MSAQRVSLHFYMQGMDYYIAGRYSARAGLNPTAGNLFHHAVELFLKGELANTHTEAQRRNMGHRLSVIWRAFKVQVNDSTLDEFDRTIMELDYFEEIRYPETLTRDGGSILVDCSPLGEPRIDNPVTGLGRVYTLYVADMDKLVGTIIRKSTFHLSLLANSLSNDALKYLVLDNAVIGGAPPDLLPQG